MNELLYLIIFITISFSRSNNNIQNILEQFRSNAQLISENQKPREWLFIGEQAFLRSFNNLNR